MIGNSGAQAINLATLWGARRLVLVGFDMCKAKVDGTEQEHWFGAHPKGLLNHSDYGQFVRGMGRMAADLHQDGVEVLNCSPISALPYWRKVTMEQALA